MCLDTIFQCWLLFPIVFSLEGFKGNLVQMFTFSDLESETALSISVQLAFKRVQQKSASKWKSITGKANLFTCLN